MRSPTRVRTEPGRASVGAGSVGGAGSLRLGGRSVTTAAGSPSPRTVTTWRGFAGSASTLVRSRRTCTSTRRPSPK